MGFVVLIPDYCLSIYFGNRFLGEIADRLGVETVSVIFQCRFAF